jgi:hypothetical protein
MAFTIEYLIPMSRERVINALRHRAVHWRRSETPESLQSLGVFRIQVRLSGSSFALFCRTTQFRSTVAWYELRGSMQSLGADTTIVQVRAGLIRRYGVYVIPVGIALGLIADGAFLETMIPLALLVYFAGFSEMVDRRLRPGSEPVINHLIERLHGAMAELGADLVVNGMDGEDVMRDLTERGVIQPRASRHYTVLGRASMRSASKLIGTVIAVVTLASSHLPAQTSQSQRDNVPHRLLVLAHPDSVSRELAAAVRRRLASDGRYEIVSERMLTQAERPVDTSADSTLTQQRALALALKAESFINIDASRFDYWSRILAIRSISNSGMVDAVTVSSDGSPTAVAQTLVDRLLPNGWLSRSR